MNHIPIVSGEETRAIYNRTFWLVYIANVLLVMGNTLTFRFAELVAYLGGSERVAGQLVGFGLFSAIVARFMLGQAIDRYGTQKLWASSCVLYIAGCLMFPACHQIFPMLYVARLLYNIGLAGMFTCSIVFIQNQVPPHRRTEVIGSLGSSGFVGMIMGAQLGDLTTRWLPAGPNQFWTLFGISALFGLVYLVLTLLINQGDQHERPVSTPPLHHLMIRHWPGAVMLVAVLMGVCISVTTVFLTRYATHRGLMGIGTFFSAYAIAAFMIRIMTRHWSRTVGRHRMVLVGVTGHFIGLVVLPEVTAEWQFIFPAACCGLGHALLFPAVVSLGAGAFPREYRGTGTTVVLGFFDLGTAVFAPILGAIIDHFDGVGFRPMFYTAAACALGTAIVYLRTAARTVDEDLTFYGTAHGIRARDGQPSAALVENNTSPPERIEPRHAAKVACGAESDR